MKTESGQENLAVPIDKFTIKRMEDSKMKLVQKIFLSTLIVAAAYAATNKNANAQYPYVGDDWRVVQNYEGQCYGGRCYGGQCRGGRCQGGRCYGGRCYGGRGYWNEVPPQYQPQPFMYRDYVD